MPSFIVKNGPGKTATKTWLFLLYFWSLLSHFLCLFPLVSPYFLFHAILEPQNSPPSEVTGIYIYAGELVLVPLFGLSRVSFGTTSRVRNSTTSWGAHFRTTKIGFFEDFCDKIWCQLVFLCFVFWAQLVSSHLLFSILNFFFCWATRSNNLGFFLTLFFKKHYKIGFF